MQVNQLQGDVRVEGLTLELAQEINHRLQKELNRLRRENYKLQLELERLSAPDETELEVQSGILVVYHGH